MHSNEATLKDKQFAADFYGVSVAKVDRWVMNGDGPRFVEIGRHVRFRYEDLIAFAEANTRGGEAA